MGMSMPAACPRCGQLDMVQQVAAIVASQHTPLAWELRAPPPPGTSVPVRRRQGGMPAWGCLLAAALVTLPLDIVILVVLATLAAVLIIALAVLAAAGVAGYALYRYLNRHVIAEREASARRRQSEVLRRYHHALSYWHQLRYCYRCHGIFLPGNPWQHAAVTLSDGLAAPGQAWALSEQLADYVDRQHAPEVLKLEEV